VSGGEDARCFRCGVPLSASADAETIWCDECAVGQEALTAASTRARTSRGLRGVLTPGSALGPFGPRTATVLAVDVWDAWSELRVLELDPTGAWLDMSDPRDGWIVWDAVDDTGTRHWAFPSTSGGSDTWLITTLSIVPAVRAEARRLRLRASYAGVTSEAEIDLTAMRRPRPAAQVATQVLPPIGGDRCRQCDAAPAERMGLCRSCGAHLEATAVRRDEDVHAAERVLVPLALQAGDVLGGPLTLLGIEILPNSFVLRLHHDLEWAVTGTCGAEPDGPASQSHPTTWGRWEVTDDRGGAYTGCNLGDHASPDGWWGDVHLRPGLDPRARRLDVRLIAAGQQVLRVGVPLDRRPGPRA